MTKTFHRNLFLNVNQYQLRVIMPMMITLVFSLVFIGIIYYLVLHFNISVEESRRLVLYQNIIPVVLILLSLFMLLFVYWIYTLTNRLLGPFERLIRELDEMLANQREWKHLKAREGDEMFEQLIQRINVLIDRM